MGTCSLLEINGFSNTSYKQDKLAWLWQRVSPNHFTLVKLSDGKVEKKISFDFTL